MIEEQTEKKQNTKRKESTIYINNMTANSSLGWMGRLPEEMDEVVYLGYYISRTWNTLGFLMTISYM